MACPICESRYRHSIDTALLGGESLDLILSEYPRLTMDQLKIHAVSHLRIDNKGSESIATQLKTREAEMLVSTYSEYMATMQRLGEVISKNLEDVSAGELTVAQAITKPVVDLYLGAGGQVREIIKLMSEIHREFSAEDAYSGRSSIQSLVGALDRSRKAQAAG